MADGGPVSERASLPPSVADRIDAPACVVHGEIDHVCPLHRDQKIADTLAPLTVMPGVGHFPQPAAPARTATSTVSSMKILQIAPALHGAKMQTSRGTFPVVVWALVQNDDGSDDVMGLAVGGKGDRMLLRPDPDTFESYTQTG